MSLPLPHAHPGLTIGDLAKAAGVNVETIRFEPPRESWRLVGLSQATTMDV